MEKRDSDDSNRRPGRSAANARLQWCVAFVISGLLHAGLTVGLFVYQADADRTTAPLSAFRSGESATFVPQIFIASVLQPSEEPPADEPQPRPAESAKKTQRRAAEIRDATAELEQLSVRTFQRAGEWLRQLTPQTEVSFTQSNGGSESAHATRKRTADNGDSGVAIAQKQSPPKTSEADKGVARTARPLQEISPQYPSASIRRGEQGLVVVEAYVLADGRVSKARVLESSGYSRLDRAALEAVRRAQFHSARRRGQGVPSWVRMPIRFALKP